MHRDAQSRIVYNSQTWKPTHCLLVRDQLVNVTYIHTMNDCKDIKTHGDLHLFTTKVTHYIFLDEKCLLYKIMCNTIPVGRSTVGHSSCQAFSSRGSFTLKLLRTPTNFYFYETYRHRYHLLYLKIKLSLPLNFAVN